MHRRKKVKPLKISDTVIHMPEGVCKVTEIIERELSTSGRHKYYILVPVYDPGTKIYVPIEGSGHKIRSLLSCEEVNNLIQDISEADYIWIEDEKKRQETYSDIIAGGDHKMVISLIRTLDREKSRKEEAGKKFHSADERIFKEAERILNEEFGFVLGIKPSSVPDYIKEQTLKED